MEHLVKGLKTDDQELQKHCASAIFKVSAISIVIVVLRKCQSDNTCISIPFCLF